MAPGSWRFLPPLRSSGRSQSVKPLVRDAWNQMDFLLSLSSFLLPISAHSPPSRCASVLLGWGGGGCHCFSLSSTSGGSEERLIRFDEWCVHAWASMSPAMRQLWSRSSRLWCHLLNDEVGRSPLVPHPPPVYTHVYERTPSEHVFLPPQLYCDCVSPLILVCIKSLALWSQW